MTATIKVFPSKLDPHTFETCHARAGQTFEAWLQANVPAYAPRERPPFSATVNGVQLAPIGWDSYVIQPNDEFELVVEAKDPVTIAWAVVAIIAVGVAVHYANQIPDTYNNTTPDSSTIYNPNAQGNQPRLMGVVPEIAGRHKVFPDLLSQPRREYIDNEQWLFLMLAVGVGEYEIASGEIYIGNTPVSRYAGDIEYEVFSPGADVSSHEAHRNVYTSPEVGSTSGSSGLELEGPTGSAGGANGTMVWSFDGTEVTAFRWFEYRDNPYDGDYVQTSFPFPVDAQLNVTGSGSGNDGDYRVVSVSYSNAVLQRIDSEGEDDTGWTGFTQEIQSSAEIVLLSGAGASLIAGPFFACPENETTSNLWLDFLMPEGLGTLNDDNGFDTRSVQIVIEYREEGGSTWTTVNHTFSDATNDQLAETIAVTLPSAIRPEVRVRRTSSAVDNVKVKDKVLWVSLKAELPGATSYDGITTLAVKIRGTNALAGSAENKFNLIATRKLPVYDGSSWSAPVATRDIAPFFAYIIKNVGHTDNQIGLDETHALHTLWSGRGDTFDAVFDNKSTLFEALKRTLAPGYAEPTLDFGQIVPVRDGPRTAFEQMYQPDNMVGDLSQDIQLIEPDEPDGVEVEYFDPHTWKPATVLCTLPGDTGQAPKKVRAFGVTDRTRAWRFGMRQRRIQRYRDTRYSFKTEMDALNSAYMSYVALADDIPGYSQTGRVDAVSGRDITLDAAVEWGTGTHYLAMRKADGRLSGPYVATATSDPYTVTIGSDLDFPPVLDGSQEEPLWMFGTAERWSYPALVTEIKPSGTDRVAVTAVNYDERVYADDDNSPP